MTNLGAKADIPCWQPYVHSLLNTARAEQNKNGSSQVGLDVEQRSKAHALRHQAVPDTG